MRIGILVVAFVLIIYSADCARTGGYPFQKRNTESGHPEEKRTGMFQINGDSNPGSNNPIVDGR